MKIVKSCYPAGTALSLIFFWVCFKAHFLLLFLLISEIFALSWIFFRCILNSGFSWFSSSCSPNYLLCFQFLLGVPQGSPLRPLLVDFRIIFFVLDFFSVCFKFQLLVLLVLLIDFWLTSFVLDFFGVPQGSPLGSLRFPNSALS